MTSSPKRVMIVGATGVFGARLVRRLAAWPEVALIVAARRRGELERLRDELEAVGAANPIAIACVDRQAPDTIAEHRPWAVIDCAGPFQASDYRLAEAALKCGAAYIDLADGRAYVAGFVAKLDALARASGLSCFTGASSTPCLTHAVLDEVTKSWRRIDRIDVAILPGARAPRGLSVMQAILSWVGRPIEVFRAGRWRTAPGWGLVRRVRIGELGARWASLADTPDLDLLPMRFHPRERAVFRAGLELPWEHLGLWLLSWPVRLRWVASLRPLARTLLAISRPFANLGSDAGGMVVEAAGVDAGDRAVRARWSLCAISNSGPTVPTLAAAALLRLLLDVRVERPGARVCAGVPNLRSVLAQAAGLPITTTLELGWPQSKSMAERLIGERFGALPLSVQRVHKGLRPATFIGRARARGASGCRRSRAAWPGCRGPALTIGSKCASHRRPRARSGPGYLARDHFARV